MLQKTISTITKDGIKLHGRLYWHEALSSRRHEVLVRYDTQFANTVLVYTLQGRFICEALDRAHFRIAAGMHTAARVLGSEEQQQALSEAIALKRGLEKAAGADFKTMLEEVVLPETRRNIIDFTTKTTVLVRESKPVQPKILPAAEVQAIEDLRDIHEMTGVPVILIGEEGIFELLSARRRIWSRVAHEVEFGPIGPTDVALYAMQVAGLDIPADLCVRIAERSIVANLPQAEGALAEMAAIDRKLAAIESDMNTSINAAKHFAQRESVPLLDRRKALADAVGTFAALNKAELFGKSRSLDLAVGVIGFRQSAQLAQQTRITSAMTLEKLREYAFTDAIRTKEEVNKDAIAAAPTGAGAAGVETRPPVK